MTTPPAGPGADHRAETATEGESAAESAAATETEAGTETERAAQSITSSPTTRSDLTITSSLTIIVPTKNERSNVARFLQTVPPDLALVVVDASDDETPEIVERVRPTATVIRALGNIPIARQLGAEAAGTDWLLFTDADVVFGPGYFEHLASLPIAPSLGGIVGTKTTLAGFDRYHRWFRWGQGALTAIGIPAATGSNMLVRADALAAVGGFDPNLAVNEDTELMFRIRRAGYGVRFAPDLTVASSDHRRLELGLARKIGHGAVRNTALYLGLFDRRVRAGDWGYWGSREQVETDVDTDVETDVDTDVEIGVDVGENGARRR